jgi:hypothetical protein
MPNHVIENYHVNSKCGVNFQVAVRQNDTKKIPKPDLPVLL